MTAGVYTIEKRVAQLRGRKRSPESMAATIAANTGRVPSAAQIAKCKATWAAKRSIP